MITIARYSINRQDNHCTLYNWFTFRGLVIKTNGKNDPLIQEAIQRCNVRGIEIAESRPPTKEELKAFQF